MPHEKIPTRGTKRKRNHRLSLDTEPDLCPRCRAICLDEILVQEIRDRSGKLVLDLGSTTDIVSHPDCSLCRALLSITPPSKENIGYHLRAVPNILVHSHQASLKAERRKLGIPPDYQGSTWLAVLPNNLPTQATERVQEVSKSISRFGCLAQHELQNPRDGGFNIDVRQLDADAADFELISSWVNFCATHHGQNCGSEADEPVPALRVIDCETRDVVIAPPNCKYAALSYVWGSESVEIPDLDRIPDPSPKTIEDAITTTLRLGLSFVWIDRYCIPQHLPREKHTQIQNMHKIYRGAQLTIVAAAGNGPSHGLPGVSSQPRVQQPQVRFGSRLFLGTQHGPQEAIEKTKWSTRAWTLQEALLSTRRLVFTDHQVYFQCNRMDCCEAIAKSLRSLYAADSKKMKTGNHAGYFAINGIGQEPFDVWGRISEYSKRHLSYDSDALNGMMGILQTFQETKWSRRRVSHLWGLPIIMEPHEPWSACVAASLCWKLTQPAQRRDGFPSWSWTGWKGVVDSGSSSPAKKKQLLGNITGFTNIDLRFEVEDGSLVGQESSSPDILSVIEGNRARLTRFLHIKSQFVELRISRANGKPPAAASAYADRSSMWTWQAVLIPSESRKGEPVPEYWVQESDVFGFELTAAMVPGRELYECLAAEQTWQGIILHQPSSAKITLLVIQERGTWVERVGVVRLHNLLAAYIGRFQTGTREVRLG